MSRFIKLFADCISVKGYKQSIIVDLQRPMNSNIIPNSLFELLSEHHDKSIEEIKNIYNNEFDDTIEGYFDFLIRNDFAFECFKEELNHFPSLDLTWKSPSLIENAIVDIELLDKDLINKIIKELSELQCNILQFRFYNASTIEELVSIGNLLNRTRILRAEIMVKYNDNYTVDTLVKLKERFPRFIKIYVYNAPDNIISSCKSVIFDTRNIVPCIDCGNITSESFSINIKTFTESISHNTCLNRKISIDKNGNIKNCPSMKKAYGNVKELMLSEVIAKHEFTKWWGICKDNIDVCKECEYRYICTDCRAFIEDEDNIHSKPIKCDYNPYIAKWKGEVGFISVNEWETG